MITPMERNVMRKVYGLHLHETSLNDQYRVLAVLSKSGTDNCSSMATSDDYIVVLVQLLIIGDDPRLQRICIDQSRANQE